MGVFLNENKQEMAEKRKPKQTVSKNNLSKQTHSPRAITPKLNLKTKSQSKSNPETFT